LTISGCGRPASLQDWSGHVDHVMELGAHLTLALIPFGQCTMAAVARAAPAEATCFVH
jgi:hypothetical protein